MSTMITRKQQREAQKEQQNGYESEDHNSNEETRDHDGTSHVYDGGALRPELNTCAGAPTPKSRVPRAPITGDSIIGITEEQLSNLLSTVMRTAMQNATASPAPAPHYGDATPSVPSPSFIGTCGNMAKCTARFDGCGGATADRIEVFIDAVEMFTECTSVSEEHVLRGLSMLFTDDAAIWWRGIKATVSTWTEATRRMRAMYGAPRPAYKLLRDIFSTEQNDERAEIFISRLRATFAKFPYEIDATLQIDIVYGLLNRKVRKSVPRETVGDLESLLIRARDAEEAREEVRPRVYDSASSNTDKGDNNHFKIPARSDSNPTYPTVKPRDVDTTGALPPNVPSNSKTKTKFERKKKMAFTAN